MVFIPSSGYKDCSVHMAEKSPTVQPSKQRSVFIRALFHVDLQDQNVRFKMEVLDDGVGVLS